MDIQRINQHKANFDAIGQIINLLVANRNLSRYFMAWKLLL